MSLVLDIFNFLLTQHGACWPCRQAWGHAFAGPRQRGLGPLRRRVLQPLGRAAAERLAAERPLVRVGAAVRRCSGTGTGLGLAMCGVGDIKPSPFVTPPVATQ